MGKKQHQKDKLYLTCTEWRTLYGGKKEGKDKGEFRRLPFFCCSLSMQPFEHPYCTKDGIIFDLMNIVPFLKKFGINPVDGEKLSAKELIKLTFHKNSNGKYHCPVTFRIFNENTHIVAIKTTGNVFSHEAVEQLNLKPSFFRDLLTDEPFTKKDIIDIQNPTNLDKFNLQKFFHLKKSLKVLNEEEEEAKKHPRYNLKSVNAETRSILDELDDTYTAPEKLADDKKKADRVNAAHYSTGKVAASFTSTSMDVETQHEAAIIDEDLLRYERIKKKGYARLITNLGPLNLELHADMIPKACENFIRHSLAGYYNGTVFHRSIRNFMIQGGDPLGTGLGGDSVWGGPFKDHFKPNLTHTGRGILSMANTGPDTNKSQFFITFRSARHLDGKHTIFGRVVGGLETLNAMEAIETDDKERPKKEIVLETCQVFVNPFDDADEDLRKEREVAVNRETSERKKDARKTAEKKDSHLKVFKSGVGKYINPATQKRTLADEANESVETKKKKDVKATFTDFSAW